MQVRQIFDGALDRSLNARSAYVSEACQGDKDLQHEVESLLAQHAANDPLLDGRFWESLAPSPASSTGRPDNQLGPYRLIERLGEGGMGEVWLAQQDQPIRRKVALKVIKLGMDTKEVVRRFESERQALAILNHPYVAKVFDAGCTLDGRPYFVMEYVPGIPITQHCDTHRLRMRDRLELFIQVCEGIQHAHQKAIIHRDLKPSNILVAVQDGKAIPKIIDFGVAKATAQPLIDGTMFTNLGVLIGTPEYMSPEQTDLTAQDVDTRTDVYSLGVILYELLVGALPFDSRELRQAGFEGARRKILDEEPVPPSIKLRMVQNSSVWARNRGTEYGALPRELKGDLEWITMKAIEKDRTRRYGSPSDLAADIRRHLAQEPVLACPPTLRYRLSKFLRRHKAGVLAASLIFGVLITGLVATGWEARVARAEKARAERRFNDLRELANWFLFDFHKTIANLAGSTPAHQLLVSKSLEYLGSLAKEAGGDPILQNELAIAYRTLGDIQGGTSITGSNLGDSAGALESYGTAMKIGESLIVANPHDVSARRELALTHEHIGVLLGEGYGDPGGQLASYKRALGLRQALLASRPEDKQDREALATSEFRIGQALRNAGDSATALEHYRQAEVIFQGIPQSGSMTSALQFEARLQGSIGVVLADTGEAGEALVSFRSALEAWKKVVAQDPNDAVAGRSLALAYDRVGDVLGNPGWNNLGDTRGAEGSYRNSLAIRRKLLVADPTNAVARRDAAYPDLQAAMHSSFSESLQSRPQTRLPQPTERRPRTLETAEIPMRVREAAIFLGVSPQTVYLWVERKQIPHLRVMGRNIRFLKSELEPFRATFKQEIGNGTTSEA